MIGIQARSTSTRLPGKVFEKIGDFEILEHMVITARECADYINKLSQKNNIFVEVALLVPKSDPIVEKYFNYVDIYEGDEHDVLSRYSEACLKWNADYIVRITSDCPLLPSALISKHINIAVKGSFDYTSNVDEMLRTSIDGWDVEVLSQKVLFWLDKMTVDPKEREHVTLHLRKSTLPSTYKVAHIINHLYQPHIKLSVDTKEDLERVRKEYDTIKRCIDIAIEKDGNRSVFRC